MLPHLSGNDVSEERPGVLLVDADNLNDDHLRQIGASRKLDDWLVAFVNIETASTRPSAIEVLNPDEVVLCDAWKESVDLAILTWARHNAGTRGVRLQTDDKGLRITFDLCVSPPDPDWRSAMDGPGMRGLPSLQDEQPGSIIGALAGLASKVAYQKLDSRGASRWWERLANVCLATTVARLSFPLGTPVSEPERQLRRLTQKVFSGEQAALPCLPSWNTPTAPPLSIGTPIARAVRAVPGLLQIAVSSNQTGHFDWLPLAHHCPAVLNEILQRLPQARETHAEPRGLEWALTSTQQRGIKSLPALPVRQLLIRLVREGTPSGPGDHKLAVKKLEFGAFPSRRAAESWIGAAVGKFLARSGCKLKSSKRFYHNLHRRLAAIRKSLRADQPWVVVCDVWLAAREDAGRLDWFASFLRPGDRVELRDGSYFDAGTDQIALATLPLERAAPPSVLAIVIDKATVSDLIEHQGRAWVEVVRAISPLVYLVRAPLPARLTDVPDGREQ